MGALSDRLDAVESCPDDCIHCGLCAVRQGDRGEIGRHAPSVCCGVHSTFGRSSTLWSFDMVGGILLATAIDGGNSRGASHEDFPDTRDRFGSGTWRVR